MTRTAFEKNDAVTLVAEVFRELGVMRARVDEQHNGAREAVEGEHPSLFPGGKEEMAAAILRHVDAWFVREVFEPLNRGEPWAATR